jgi:hypothetical protein
MKAKRQKEESESESESVPEEVFFYNTTETQQNSTF